MSSWRVEQHYGFGAARIPIRPEAHRAARATLGEGLADVAAELAAGGPLAMARRIVGQSPAILLGLLLFGTFVTMLVRDHSDLSPVEVVLFDTPPLVPEVIPLEPIPEPALPQPEPEPILVAQEPPPPPRPLIERSEPPPPPPPEIVVERPKPPPPRRRLKPVPSVERPAMPQIAFDSNEPPPPRLDRAVRARPESTGPRPRIELAAVAPRPVPVEPIAPTRSPVPAPVMRPDAPRLAAPAAASPVLSDPRPPPRSFRVASVPSVPSSQRPRAVPGLAPVPREPTPLSTPSPTRSHPSGPRPSARPAPSVAPVLAASPAPAHSGPRPADPGPQRTARAAPTPSPRRAARPTAEMARAPSATAPAAPTPAARVARLQHEMPRGSESDRPGLAGVPLGELSACIRDREEDRLKQAVVAAVKTQDECVSRAGTYRFVETKNLNSFLMWIDRSSGRAVGDRCDELRLALECLQGARRRAAR